MSNRILIVDDEELIRWSLGQRLAAEGFIVTEAADGNAAKLAIRGQAFDAALLDLRLPDIDGLALLEQLLQAQPELPVIMITAYSSVDSAVQALKGGAADYLTKPFDMDELVLTLNRTLDQRNLLRSVSADLRQKNEQFGIEKIVGDSPAIAQLKHLLRQIAAAPAPSTILLLGESGTGKDLVARSLHYESSRASHPFMNITCTALPESLLESELFGYEAGAFTGASTRKKGLFELADHGTVFLDEIGDTPPLLQAKLLRVLEEKTFKRIGGSADIHVDVRIIAATNQNLEVMTEQKRFREDLYYRLNMLPVHLPPLRERREDIAPIALHFLHRFAREFKKPFRGFSEEGMARMAEYPWPGNVRELRNVVERAALLSQNDHIQAEELVLGRARIQHAPSASSATNAPLPTLAEAEAQLLKDAMERAGDNLTQAGKLLGISRDQVRYKIEKHGIRGAQDDA